MSFVGSNILAGASGSQGSADFKIDRSLRFNSGDSAYLNRTPSSAGDQKKWTWSGWVKRSTLGTNQTIFSANSGVYTDAGFLQIYFTTSDTLKVFGSVTRFDSVEKFSDPSAWYHIVAALDTTLATAGDRIKLYVNGTRITKNSGTDIGQNTDLAINNNINHYISSYNGSNELFNGYLAEIHLIDGQALAATDFGKFDDNNVWQPKRYSGSYGSNGFYLKFENNSSVSALGTDSSGNNNDWTVNNLSVTAGATNDSLLDTPTDYEADSGNPGGNYCTLNPLTATTNFTATDGNLKGTMSSGTGGCLGTMAFPKTGKWYFEVVFDSVPGYNHVGIATAKSNCIVSNANPGYDTTNEFTYWQNGNKTNNVAYGATFAANDVIGVAFDADAGSLVFYKNGTSQGVNATGLFDTYFPFIPGYSSYTSVSNFGQRPWAQTPPTGYKALCTFNFPDPAIADGSTAFNAVLRNGFGTSGGTVTVGFSPGLLWEKTRSSAGSHSLYDAVRGAGKILNSNNTNAESTDTNQVNSFTSTGYTVGTNEWSTSTTLVGWAWDGGDLISNSAYNQSQTWTSTVSSSNTSYQFPIAAGFDGTVTGDGGTDGFAGWTSNGPITLTFSNLSASSNVVVYAGSGLNGTISATCNIGGYSYTQSASSGYVNALTFSNTGAVTTLSLTSGGGGVRFYGIKVDGKTLVDPGVISVGSLNSSSYNTSQNWSSNYSGNNNVAPTQAFNGLGPVQNGYAHQGASLTLTFNPALSGRFIVYGGSGGGGADDYTISDGTNTTTLSSNQSYASAPYFEALDFGEQTGITSLTCSAGYTLYGIRVAGKLLVDSNVTPPNAPSIASTVHANPSAGFSIVSYTGTATAGTIGHGLNAKPSIMLIKSRDSADSWYFYTDAIDGSFDYNQLEGTGSFGNSSLSLPTSSVFSVGSAAGTNKASDKFIAYCFAPVEGYSAFGSYTGNSSADGPFVYTGFRPAFLLWKRSDGTANWYIYDSARNTYNVVNDNLEPNTSDTENTLTSMNVDFTSNGFKIRGSDGDINASSGNYVYAAFAENPFKTARAR
tara:strand:+ start:4166 stop:7327 length:3162 start_codon:yes stop_codon:yes gene_type:complete